MAQSQKDGIHLLDLIRQFNNAFNNVFQQENKARKLELIDV
jgi:predicted transposase